MTELEQQIKKNRESILSITKQVKDLLSELQDVVKEQSMLLTTYKGTVKSYFSRKLSDLFEITPGEVNVDVKRTKAASKINKIDRVYLELLCIIQKPFRKNTTRKSITPNTLNTVANHLGQIRLLNEKGISKDSKVIIKQLLNQLQTEI
jgi:hypothetical protein